MGYYSKSLHVVLSVMMLIAVVNSLQLEQEDEPQESNSCQRVAIEDDWPRKHYIIRGNEAYPGEFPYQVAIFQEGNFSCGGVIVDKHHILTAAHCIIESAETFEEVGLNGYLSIDPLSFTVAVGEHNLVKYDGEQFYEIEQAVFHSRFGFSPGNFDSRNDIAILRTKKEMKFNLNPLRSGLVAPVCLPSGLQSYRDSERFVASGWGSTLCSDKTSSSEVLKKTELIRRPNPYCHYTVDDEIICARGIEGSHVFHGDSGSGLVRLVNNRYELVGIVSSGKAESKCLLPATFTRVDAFLDWIYYWMNN